MSVDEQGSQQRADRTPHWGEYVADLLDRVDAGIASEDEIQAYARWTSQEAT